MESRHPVNQKLHDQRSKTDERVDKFVQFFGSLKFIAWQTVVIIFWVFMNALEATNAIHYDRYPFILLNLIFSTQAAYAAPLILMASNRQEERDRLKAEHDYEVNQNALDDIRAIKTHLGIQ